MWGGTLIDRDSFAGELIDLPSSSLLELAQNLKDMAFINKYMGVHRMVRFHLGCLLRKRAHLEEIRVLDLATGSGDVPVSLIRWARQRNLKMRVVGLDINKLVLSIARGMSSNFPEIDFMQGDLLNLPFKPSSFDYVLCNTALHHFDFHQGVKILGAMARISRYGLIATDLCRGTLPYLLALGVCHLISRNKLTRNDGPLSVTRSYTLRELSHLAHSAGLKGVQPYRHPFFRIAMIYERKA